MSKLWAKLMSEAEHSVIRTCFAGAKDDEGVSSEVIDILNQAASRLEVRYHQDSSKLTDPQRRFLSMWFVLFFTRSDGLDWVAENAAAAIPDAAEACAALGLAKTQKLLEGVQSLFGGADRMRDEDVVQEMWENDDGSLAASLDEMSSEFYDIQADESMLRAQLRVVCQSPKDFADA